jgi:glycosyltransferase involved in cell wall biosynthesis
MGSKAGAILQRFLPYNDQLPWVAHAVEAARHLVASQRPVAIISTSPPIACHLAAWLCSRRYGLPWIADFRDPLYGNPSRNRSWGWIWDAPVDRLINSKAAAVIANTDAAADMLRIRYPQMSHKIHLIWNGYDPEQTIGPLPLPERSYKLLVHAGSLYGQRHPTILFESLHRLMSSGKLNPTQVKVRLVGEFYQNDRWLTESKFSELVHLGCVEHTAGAVTADEAVREMAESDYLLLLDLNDRGIGLQVPAKIFEYIRIGRPILAFTGRNSPVERILGQSGIRHICLHGDSPAEEIDHQLLSLLAFHTSPLKPSAWFEEQFNATKQSEALAVILDKVSNGNPVSGH